MSLPSHSQVNNGLKQRHAHLGYLFVWLTGGMYVFYWGYQIARDLNIIYGKQVLHAKSYIVTLTILLVIYIIAFTFAVANFGPGGNPNIAGIGMTFAFSAWALLVATFITQTVILCIHILRLSGQRKNFGKFLSLFVFSLLWFYSYARMQTALNQLIANRSGSQASPNSSG